MELDHSVADATLDETAGESQVAVAETVEASVKATSVAMPKWIHDPRNQPQNCDEPYARS